MPLLVSFCATFLRKAVLKSNQQTKDCFSTSVKLCGISQTWQPTTQCNYFYFALTFCCFCGWCFSYEKKNISETFFQCSGLKLYTPTSSHTNFTGIPKSKGDFVGFHTVHFHTHALNSPQSLLRCGLWHSIVTGVLEYSFNCI